MGFETLTAVTPSRDSSRVLQGLSASSRGLTSSSCPTLSSSKVFLIKPQGSILELLPCPSIWITFTFYLRDSTVRGRVLVSLLAFSFNSMERLDGVKEKGSLIITFMECVFIQVSFYLVLWETCRTAVLAKICYFYLFHLKPHLLPSKKSGDKNLEENKKIPD